MGLQRGSTLLRAVFSVAIFFALVFSATPGRTADQAHVHGVASMEMVVSGNIIRVLLRSPMDNLLGFERIPRSEAQKADLEALKSDLSNPLLFLSPPVQAGCQVRHHEASSSLFGGKSPSAHSDLEYRFSFECRDPLQLTILEVPMFDRYRRLREIRVQLVSDQGQRSVVLVRRNRQLRLR